MWFCLFCLLLLGGMAYFQAIQGLFNGLIFCVIAVISTALAFTLYEFVAYEFIAPWKPDLALPIALAGCFGLPLVGLRLALDRLVQRAGLLPTLADKAGGACFGLVTALLCIGVSATAIQMLPFGGSFMAFSRFDLPSEGSEDEEKTPASEVNESAARTRAADDHHVWLSPDRFAVGMASMLSDGLFSGQRSFRQDHPDLLVEIGWSQALEAGPSRLAKPGSVSVEPPRIIDYVYSRAGSGGPDQPVQYQTLAPEAGRAFWVYRVRPGPDAADSDGTHRCALPQIRLVGRDQRDNPAQFIPTAVRDGDDPLKHVKLERHRRDDRDILFELWEPGDDGVYEVAFEVPEGFTPTFIAYKQGARAEVSQPNPEDRLPPPAAAPTGSTDDSPSSGGRSGRRGRRRGSNSATPPDGGRVTGLRTHAADSFFGDQLPITLTAYQSPPGDQPSISNDTLREGAIVAQPASQGAGGSQRPLARFHVPEDKRLLQLSVETLRAGSTLGKSLEFATRTLRNYLVTDDNGTRYEMVGQYAIANVDGQQVLEIQYYPEQIGSMGGGVGEFSRIKRRHLAQNDTQLVFLFQINRGRQAVQFATGRRGRVDLKPFDLKAE